MQQAGKQFLRQILQNPQTGRTILVEGNDEDWTYKKVIDTGEELECIVSFPFKWKEAWSGEEFIIYGIEVSDGLSSKVYAPIPEFIYRLRFASGRAFFALSGDHEFLDAVTQSPVKIDESGTIESFSTSMGRFTDGGGFEIGDEDDEDDEEEYEDTDEEITLPATVTLQVRKAEHTGDLHTYHLTLIDSKHLSEPVLFLLQVSESGEAELFEDD